MERQNSSQNWKEPDRTKERYEPPKATFVPVKLDERLMACDYLANDNPPCGSPKGA